MPEPMSAVEIEDVLSSIRRLVSEDLRPAAPAPAITDSRLLLTPALRVVPRIPPETWVEAEGAEEDWAEEVPPPLGTSGWSLPETEPEPSELEAALSIPLPVLPDPAPAATAPVPEAPALPPHRFTLTQAARVSPGSPAEAALWEIPAAPESPAGMPEGQRADLPESRLPESGAPAGEVAGSLPDAATLQDAGLSEAELPDLDLPDLDLPDLDLPEPEVILDEAGLAVVLEDLPEALDRHSTPDPHWAERAAAEAIAGLHEARAAREPLEPMSEEDPAFFDDPEAGEPTYDEVVLRELVRDILREELAGSLGEKITRNIRKLVRAEIAQALATRNL